FTVTGLNLAGSTFTFTPSRFLTTGTPTINAAGTQATFMPNERGQFREGAGATDLEAGLVPIAIESYEGNGPVDIQLSFAPPHAERRVITPDLLVSSADVAITDTTGNFSFSDVPTA